MPSPAQRGHTANSPWVSHIILPSVQSRILSGMSVFWGPSYSWPVKPCIFWSHLYERTWNKLVSQLSVMPAPTQTARPLNSPWVTQIIFPSVQSRLPTGMPVFLGPHLLPVGRTLGRTSHIRKALMWKEVENFAILIQWGSFREVGRAAHSITIHLRVLRTGLHDIRRSSRGSPVTDTANLIEEFLEWVFICSTNWA